MSSRQDKIQKIGRVLGTKPGGDIRVSIEGLGKEILARRSGNMRRFGIGIVEGDKVKVEIPVQGKMDRGIIVFRENTKKYEG